MTAKQIKELDAHSSLLDTDLIPVQDATLGDGEKATISEVASYVKTKTNSFDKVNDTLDDIID
jgi:hypothetical protein